MRTLIFGLAISILPIPAWEQGETYPAIVTQESGEHIDPRSVECRWYGRIADPFGRTDGVYSPWPLRKWERVRCRVDGTSAPSAVIERLPHVPGGVANIE